MARNPITKHGRDHRPSGSDPINAIFYDTYNDGGFLDVTTENYLSFINNGDGGTTITDNGDLGVGINASDHISVINTGGTAGINIQQSGGSAGIALSDTSSDGIFLTATHKMELSSVTGMKLTDEGGGVKLFSAGTPGDHHPLSSAVADLAGIGAGDSSTAGTVVLSAFDAAHGQTGVFLGTFSFPGSPFSGLTFTGVLVQAVSGQKFAVCDHQGFPIFEARNDGSVHIRSGHAVVADL